jgi:hypothetical protein
MNASMDPYGYQPFEASVWDPNEHIALPTTLSTINGIVNTFIST